MLDGKKKRKVKKVVKQKDLDVVVKIDGPVKLSSVSGSVPVVVVVNGVRFFAVARFDSKDNSGGLLFPEDLASSSLMGY